MKFSEKIIMTFWLFQSSYIDQRTIFKNIKRRKIRSAMQALVINISESLLRYDLDARYLTKNYKEMTGINQFMGEVVNLMN